jgi:hypothetical protein
MTSLKLELSIGIALYMEAYNHRIDVLETGYIAAFHIVSNVSA